MNEERGRIEKKFKEKKDNRTKGQSSEGHFEICDVSQRIELNRSGVSLISETKQILLTRSDEEFIYIYIYPSCYRLMASAPEFAHLLSKHKSVFPVQRG